MILNLLFNIIQFKMNKLEQNVIMQVLTKILYKIWKMINKISIMILMINNNMKRKINNFITIIIRKLWKIKNQIYK